MNSKVLLILITCYLCNIPVNTLHLKVCDNARLAQFHIPKAENCWQGKHTEEVKMCKGQIVNPLHTMAIIEVAACSISTTKWEGIWCFWCTYSTYF